MKRILLTLLVLMILSCNHSEKSKKPKSETDKPMLQTIQLLTISKPASEYMEALTAGQLLIDSSGCLKVGENTLIWPYGYSLGKNKNAIYDEKGKPVAEIGNHLQLSGGECSNCSKEHIKQLTGHTPSEECHGKYWIIGEEIRVK